MSKLEKKIYRNFEKNLKYLKETDLSLYKKVSSLNESIANQSYQERYALEYINDYFDIKELRSNGYLYNQNSGTHAKILAKSITYKKSDSVIEGFYNTNLTLNDVKKFDNNANAKNILYATASLIFYNNTVTSKNDNMKTINKYFIGGVGLGLHIEQIIETIQPKEVFIAEDDIEIFRLSLFTTPYYILANKASLFFSIAQNDQEYKITFDKFYAQNFAYNHYIKYSLLSSNDMEKIKRFQSSLVAVRHFTYPYSIEMTELLKAPEYLVEKFPFIKLQDTCLTKSYLTDKPLLLIAAGPSLDKNIEWLRENQNNFCIIAVLGAARTLYAENIKIDIATHIHGDDRANKLLDNIDDPISYFKDTLFIFSSVTPRKIVDTLPKENIYFFESASNYKQNTKKIVAPSIGETTYALSLLFGANKIYLLGLDLSLDKETYKTHSKHHSFESLKQIEKNATDENVNLYKSVVMTKGNFSNEVPTLLMFDVSIKSFNSISKTLLKNSQKVYNLSDGAYLEGAVPLSIDKVPTSASKETKCISTQDIKQFFDSISENYMNQDDIKFFDAEIQEAIRLVNILEKFKKDTTTESYSLYMQEFYKFFKELVNLSTSQKHNINTIFASYIKYISGYLFDIFNTQELQDESLHVKNINAIFIKEVSKILILYTGTLKIYKQWIEKEEA